MLKQCRSISICCGTFYLNSVPFLSSIFVVFLIEFFYWYSKKASILSDRRMKVLSDRSPCSVAQKPRQTLNTAQTVLTDILADGSPCSVAHKPRQTTNTAQMVLSGTFSSFRNKSHTGRNTAKQGANRAVHIERPKYSSSSSMSSFSS